MSEFDARVPARHLPTSVRVVGLVLADSVAADGIGEVGVQEIAQDAGVSVSTVVRAVRRLRDEGLLYQDHRGHNTPIGAYVSTWRLASTGQPATLTAVSTGQPDRLTGVSTGQPATLTRLNRSPAHVEGGSTGQIDTSPLGREVGREEGTLSSSGVSLTRGGDAPRADLPEEGEVYEVFRQIPDVLRATHGDQVRRQKMLIRQRLDAGRTVADLIEEGRAAGVQARGLSARGEPVRSKVGYWATLVPLQREVVVDVRSEQPRPAALPWDGLPWCQLCDEVDRRVEDSLGRLAPCPECNPKGIERGRRAAAF